MPDMIQTRPDWEEAARESKARVAVSYPQWITLDGGRRVEAELHKPLHGDGVWKYKHSAVVIRKATTREVDAVRRWKRYQ